MRYFFVLVIAVAGLFHFSARWVSADTYIWDQPAFGVFGFNASWEDLEGNSVYSSPGVDDSAYFGATITTTHTLYNPISVQFLVDEQNYDSYHVSGDYEWRFGNPDITYTANWVEIGVPTDTPGLSPTASLLVDIPQYSSPGQVESHMLSIGKTSRPGALRLEGSGTSWNNTGSVSVGGGYTIWIGFEERYPGTGQLEVAEGASMQIAQSCEIGYKPGSIGVVTVNGTGSTFTSESLYVGGIDGGSGELTVINGGAVDCSGYDCIIGGYQSDSIGAVTVDGTGSTLTCAGDLMIYGFGGGSATLTIDNDGAVSVDGMIYIESDSGSSASIFFGEGGGTLTGNCFKDSPEQFSGTGTINTRGLVSDVDLVFDANHGLTQTLLLNEPGRNITVNLDISGANGVAEDLGIGHIGSGSLTIRDAVSVECRNGSVGYYSGSTGTATVDGAGSSWICAEYLDVGGNGNGTLSINNGGLVSVAETLTIDYDAEGNGFVDIYNGGMLALLGDADDSLASFLELIEGTDAIRYWDFEVSAWNDISGATPGVDYILSYQTAGDLAGYTLLTVLAAMGGDANGDGVVDVSDLGVLATNYGTTSGAEWADGDFNGDSEVDVSDLGILATMYGKTIEAPLSQTVPEPSGIVLLTMGAVGLLLCARRKER